MTAPDSRQSDELRGLIAEALAMADSEGLRRVAYVGEPQRYGLSRVVDALLPEVTAWHEKAAEAQARARAAAELRKAAMARMNGAGGQPLGWLLDRADALAADDRTDPA